MQGKEWYKNPVVNQLLGVVLSLILAMLYAKFGITPQPVEIVVPPASEVHTESNVHSIHIRLKE